MSKQSRCPSRPSVSLSVAQKPRTWWRALALLPAVATVAVSVVVLANPTTSVAAPPYPAPVMTGYVPLEADATRQTMANANSAADTTLDFTVGITNAGAGAYMYYDHWEDGYEADLTNPVQATTLVWGDGDITNGNAQTYCGTRCAGDLLPAGAVFVLRNDIPTPRTTSVLWDGRDRVSSTRGFAITAGGFTTPLGSVLSASASAYDTSKWGTDYWIPIGEDMTPPAGTSDAFSTTSVQIMADQPGTVVEVDRTGDGVTDVTQTIGQGQVMFVNGGVNHAARVRSSKPVQVHVGAGDAGAAYELRWFTLFPTNLLTADYLNPVGSSVDAQRTITYLFNPSAAAITITPTCTGCSGTINVPAKGTVSYASPISQAVRFASAGNVPFAAVGAGGSQSGAAPGATGSDGSATYDWGFGLVPTRLLTSKAVLGWAPGNSANPPNVAGNRDDDPVWISAMSATTLYIDYDGDPTTGSLGPACDGNYDETRSVAAFASTKIFDNTDGDMTGASIYTCDGTLIAGAWGEDAANAPTGAPGFDAGYALIPSTSMVVNKTHGMALDANNDGRFGPGDRIVYDIAIADAGAVSFTNLEVVDQLPAGTSYVAGSTTYDEGDGIDDPFPDDSVGPAATAYPFDEDGVALPTINPGTTVHIKYQLEILNPFPIGTQIANVVDIEAVQTDGGDTDVIDLIASDLSLSKVVSGTPPTYLGDSITFTLTVSNAGPDTARAVAVTDLLPPGLTFQSATPGQGTYNPATGVWAVGTLASGDSLTLQLTARVDALSVTNSAEITASDSADPDSSPGNGSTTEDDDATASVTVIPRADVSLTKTVASGPDASGNTTFTLTLSNAGPGQSGAVQVTDYPAAGWTFVSSSPQTSAVADGTFDGGTGVWSVPDLAPGGQAQIHVVYNTPVAPGTNYAQVTSSSVFDPDSQPDTSPLSGGNLPDQDDEASAGIAASGDVSVTNQVTTDPTYVGDLATFLVTVSNAGPTDTTGVMVTDLLPAGLWFVSSTPSVGTYTSSTGVWNVGPMAAGGSQTLSITARVMEPGALTTTAELTGSTAADIDSTPNNHVATEDDQADAGVSTTGASIGDTVWYDVDNDFVLDSGEPGLAGVQLTVLWAGPNGTFGNGDDVSYPTITTDPDGTWSSAGLPAGQYRVTVDPGTLPSGIATATADRDGSATPNATELALAATDALTDVDFAYTSSGSIGDTVYYDRNASSTFDVNEGIAGVRVDLVWLGVDGVVSSDDVTYTTLTDILGGYLFTSVPAGNYTISVDTSTLPAGLANTVDPDGGNDDAAAFSLTDGQSLLTADFGYGGTNSIGDTVFVDIDGDGTQDAGEPGLGGVQLDLTLDADSNGSYETVVGSTTTSGSGTYQFGNLAAGAYRVSVVPPTGLTATTPADVSTTLSSGETFTSADFGLTPPAAATPGSIGDLVWDDTDGDGVRDAGEPGAAGVLLTLRADQDGNGSFETLIATQPSAGGSNAGRYSFANLTPGRYLVEVTPGSGDSTTTPSSYVVDLAAGADHDTADFGLSSNVPATASIGDRVWDDSDGDGAQDVGELGLAGVTVTLRADSDNDGTYETVLDTAITDSTGNYEFDGLAPGRYAVVAGTGSGWFATTPTSMVVTLSVGQTLDTADFGMTQTPPVLGSIGDRVWLDADRDGVQDAGEPGTNGVSVTLLADPDGDGVFDTIVTAIVTSGDGNYSFMVAPGRYSVVVTAPSGMTSTTPAPIVEMVAGADVDTADIGLALSSNPPYDLAIQKVADEDAVVGTNMSWTLTVTNNSATPAPPGVVVTDVLPSGLTYVSASGTGWACSASAQTVTCTHAASFAGSQVSQISIVTGVSGAPGGSITNAAAVAAAGAELTMTNNDDAATVVLQSPPPDPVAPTIPPNPTIPVITTPQQPPASTTTVAGNLPRTGSDSTGRGIEIATMLVAAGLGALTVSRIRRRSAT